MDTVDTVERTRHSWELTTEPIRPSKPDLVYMSEQIKKRFDQPRVLIMGMTPELIGMAKRAGASRVVVMELRSIGIEAYTQLADDTFESVNGDWREFHPQCEAAFDVIIGHGPFIFLKFPEEWISTLAVMRRYLAPGGAMIMRHFHVPPEGNYPFLHHYERLLADFEALTRKSDTDVRSQEFIKTVTSLRCTAILAATQENGVVDQVELDRVMALAKQDLEQRYGQEQVWPLMRAEFDYPTAAGYGSVRPWAAPTLEQVKPVLEAGGLSIDDVTLIGDLPSPGCFAFISGTLQPA